MTGLGIVSPVGVGVKHAWRNLVAGKSGVVSLTNRRNGEAYAKIPSTVAAVVPTSPGGSVAGQWDASEWLNAGDDRRMALFTQYAMAAGTQAVQDAQLPLQDTKPNERAGVCCGSGIGSLEDVVSAASAYSAGSYRSVSPLFIPRLLINLAAGHLSIKYGLTGPNHAASTACTTGLHSIGDAMRFIQYGDADVMLAGGTEACIHPLTLAGFARARSLATKYNDSPHEASRPFDRGRDGFVIGEGAGMMVLETLDHAQARGARIYAEVKGYGLSGDANHLTAPPEAGTGAALCMRRALAHARVEPGAVDYVNAHATSTQLGDVAEARAIQHVLGEGSSASVSSCKGAFGHLLGAAGAVEAIATVMAIHEGVIPPTLNLHDPDTDDGKLNIDYVGTEARKKEVNVALANSFGFGGTNASICFARCTY